jgi:hypothetical protein
MYTSYFRVSRVRLSNAQSYHFRHNTANRSRRSFSDVYIKSRRSRTGHILPIRQARETSLLVGTSATTRWTLTSWHQRSKVRLASMGFAAGIWFCGNQYRLPISFDQLQGTAGVSMPIDAPSNYAYNMYSFARCLAKPVNSLGSHVERDELRLQYDVEPPRQTAARV